MYKRLILCCVYLFLSLASILGVFGVCFDGTADNGEKGKLF